MSVSSTTTTVSYTGDGSVTSFAVTFPFKGTAATSEITVVERVIATGVETTKSYTTHYTVTGGNGETGTVTAASAPASTVQWHIRRNTTATQTTDYVTNDPFAANTIEGDFDRLAMLGQERDGDLAQAFKYPDTYTGGASVTMPEPVASAYLLWNAAADALITSTDSSAQFLGGNGTVSLPFYSFTSDPDSGIYRIGANNLGVAVNGTKVVDITTTGINSTVIGATTPAAGTFSSITSGGAVLSDTDSTDSLGSTGVRWLKLWVDSIQTTANLDVAGNLVVTGNLTINGTTVTNDATNTEIKDPLIELNSGAGSNANDLGFIFERGSTGDNAFLGWDESGDYFVAATTTAVGSSTGNITYAFAPFKCSAITATSGTLAGITSLGLNAGATITAGILDQDTMSSDSAVALATQQSIKAYVDTSSKAAGIQMTWETATSDSDQGVGKVWASASSFTPGSDYTLYFDDVERNSVSINALIDSLDDPTATNSATIYIQEAGTASAGLVFLVNGSITSASTYSKCAVEHVATFGTLTDGDVVGVTIAFSGNNGSGTGDLLASNNLSDVSTAATAFSNIKQAASTTATGVAETSTNAEAITGTDTARYITPANLHAALAGLTDATITAADTIIFADVGSSNALKEDTVQGILDLTSSGATDAEKTNIILNAFRISVNGGLSVQNMVDGVVDEFEDQTGVDDTLLTPMLFNGTNDIYSNVTISAYNVEDADVPSKSVSEAALDDNDTSTTQNMGNPNDCSGQAVTAINVGGDKTRMIIYVDLGAQYSLTSLKIWQIKSNSVTGTGQFYYSTDGSSYSTWSTTFTITTSEQDHTKTDTQTGRYVALVVEAKAWGGSSIVASEFDITFTEGHSAKNTVTISEPVTALAEPSDAFLVIWNVDIDASTPNTDFKGYVTRDNGQTFTSDYGTDEKLDTSGHGFSNTDRVTVDSSGSDLPAGLFAGILYYVVNKTTNDFELSLTSGGSAVDITDNGTGTHKATKWAVATLVTETTLATGEINTDTIDISGLPTGTTMKWLIETLNTKGINFHAVGLQWS
jgi:hypothetical protein